MTLPILSNFTDSCNHTRAIAVLNSLDVLKNIDWEKGIIPKPSLTQIASSGAEKIFNREAKTRLQLWNPIYILQFSMDPNKYNNF